MMRSIVWLSAMLLFSQSVSLDPGAQWDVANKKGGPSAHPYLDLTTILGFAGNIGFSSGVARAKSAENHTKTYTLIYSYSRL
jgi:hypothetical protein